MNETSKTSSINNYNSFLSNIENQTKKVLNNDKYKTHYKQKSMDVKFEKNKINLPYKNFHLVKEILISQNGNTSINNTSTQFNKDKKSSSNKDLKPDNKKHTPNSKSISNSNALLNQNGLVCFNNINIYNSNKSNNTKQSDKNPKTNDINLRQYLFNKVNSDKTNKFNMSKHVRSNSNNPFH